MELVLPTPQLSVPLSLQALATLTLAHDTSDQSNVNAIFRPLILDLQSTAEKARDSALETLFELAQIYKVVRLAIAFTPVIPTLVEFLRDGTDHQKSQAARTLGYLVDDNQPAMVRNDLVTPLIVLLRCGSNDQKLAAAALADRLSSKTATLKFLDSQQVVGLLLPLVYNGPTYDHRKHALGALLNRPEGYKLISMTMITRLLVEHDEPTQLLAFNALFQYPPKSDFDRVETMVVRLVELLSITSSIHVAECTALAIVYLTMYANNKINRQLMVDAGGIDVLVSRIGNGTSRLQGYVSNALVILGTVSKHVHNEITKLCGNEPERWMVESVLTADEFSRITYHATVMALTSEGKATGAFQGAFIDVGGLAVLVSTVQQQITPIADHALVSLHNIAHPDSTTSNSRHAEICAHVEDAKGIEVLIQLVRSGTSFQKDMAAKTLESLARHSGPCASIVSCGGKAAFAQLHEETKNTSNSWLLSYWRSTSARQALVQIRSTELWMAPLNEKPQALGELLSLSFRA